MAGFVFLGVQWDIDTQMTLTRIGHMVGFVLLGCFSSLLLLDKNIQVCLGWDVSHMTGHVVFCKRFRDEGLQMFMGMAWYCVKANGEEHFEFVHHNVFANNIILYEGKLECTKFKNIGLNNCVSLSHSTILQRAHQWACFCLNKHLGVTLLGILFHMCKSGQFYPNPTLIIPMRFLCCVDMEYYDEFP